MTSDVSLRTFHAKVDRVRGGRRRGLTRDLLDIVGRDGNLLLNIGPDDTGTIPGAAATQLRGIGTWLNTNGPTAGVYGATYTGLVDDPTWGAVTRKGNKLYLYVYSWPAAGTPLHLTAHDFPPWRGLPVQRYILPA